MARTETERDELYERLVARFEVLETENERLRTKVTGLEAVVDAARPPLGLAATEEETHPRDWGQPLSRRRLFRLGTAAAAGAGVAVAGSVVGAAPAAAAPLSGDSDSGHGVIGSTTSDDHAGVYGHHSGHGAAVHGRSERGHGVLGVAGDAGHGVMGLAITAHGVVGESTEGSGVFAETASRTHYALEAHNTNAMDRMDGEPNSAGAIWAHTEYGPGVVAISRHDQALYAFGQKAGLVANGVEVGVIASSSPGRPQVALGPHPDAGPPVGGDHRTGEFLLDASGVLWLCTASGTPGSWVRNMTTGENAVEGGTFGSTATGGLPALQGRHTGIGHALVGVVANASSAGNPIRGITNGSGHAIYGLINKTSSVSNAIRAESNGIGTGILGVLTNSSNNQPASRGLTNGPGVGVQGDSTHASGRGGQFSGGAAQVRLIPAAGARPASGAAGDVFLDNNKNLWLCKGGSAWAQLG